MKKIQLVFLMMFSSFIVNGQVVVSFTKSEINTIESKEEVIKLPIIFSGSWPKDKTSFKVNLKITGEASQSFDYNLDKTEIDVNKDNINIIIPTIKIINDKKFDPKEQIVIELLSSDADAAKIDDKNNKLVIDITDSDPSVSDVVLARVNKDIDTTEAIATIRLQNDVIKSFGLKSTVTNPEGSNPLRIVNDEVDVAAALGIKVERVNLTLQDGVISEINLTAQDTVANKTLTFTNIVSKRVFYVFPASGRRYAIPARYQQYKSYIDLLPLWGTNSFSRNKFVYFGDLINYTPTISRNYPPSDAENLELTPKSKLLTITNKTALTNYINLNIYTDFLALVKAEKGNGLVQTEAVARIYMNTKNIKDRFVFAFNYLEVGVRYSRFDIGYNYVTPEAKDTTINRMLLNQRSFLVAGIKSNLYRKLFRFYSSFELNTAFNINWVNIRGNLISNVPNQTPEYSLNQVNLYSWVIEPKMNIPQYRNFGISFAYPFFVQTIFNKTKDVGFKNKDWKWYSVPEVELYYYPIYSSKDKIFLRFRGFIDNEGTDPNFLQMQVGYKGQFNFNAR